MGTYWWLTKKSIILLFLLWWSANMQSCQTSTTQMTVGVSFYNNGSAGFAFVPRDILVDSSFNQYLLYLFDNSGQNIRITKINTDGTYAWSKEYAGLIALRNF